MIEGNHDLLCQGTPVGCKASQPVPLSQRKIASVVRILRFTGWLLVGFFSIAAATVLLGVLIGIPLAIVKDRKAIPMMLVAALGMPVFGGIAYLCHGYVRTSRRLEAGEAGADRTAIQLMIPWMVFGFPGLTILGYIVQKWIRNHYPRYCRDIRHPANSP